MLEARNLVLEQIDGLLLSLWNGRQGLIQELTQSLGLDRFIGWWNGVTTGDLNGDGRLEIIATNWGRNNQFYPFLEEGLHLFYGDFNGNGRIDTIEAYLDPELKKIVPWRDWQSLTRALPFILERFPDVDPKSGTGHELKAIAAAVVGGVAISGGRGKLWGVLAGALLLAFIAPALVFLGAPAQWEKAIQGAIILLAVAADGWRQRSAAI